MTALLVVLMFVGFAVLDIVVRAVRERLTLARVRDERQQVLQTSLRLDFTHEAPSLKRVEVPSPRARILAVDDEPVVLDSFRKILVLSGLSVDTVESGPEALGLIQRRDYDFVFTDLKMPGMDGVEVVKAVRHLRPDIDVAVITGYGTIETAVETMQHGAVDYVQKPFTEDELSDFAHRLLIKREARLEAQRLPVVRIVAASAAPTTRPHEYCVPGGAFLSEGHAWARIEPDGHVRAGLDDFVRKTLGSVDGVELPLRGETAKRGEPLFALRRGARCVHLVAPLSGRVVQINEAIVRDPSRAVESPYDAGWICLLQPSDLAGELKDLRIGQAAVAWLQEEIMRWRASTGAVGATEDWLAFEEQFLQPAALTRS
jgi:CheY-like chemotaxis protein